MIQYLYPDHTAPSPFLVRNGVIVPARIYLAANKYAYFGLVPHHFPDTEPPYGSWYEVNGEWYCDAVGTEEERSQWKLEKWREEAEVSALQGMKAIGQAGMVEVFNTWIAGLDPVNDFEALAFFQKAPTWKRDNPYLIAGATALLLTDEQVDQLFILAETL